MGAHSNGLSSNLDAMYKDSPIADAANSPKLMKTSLLQVCTSRSPKTHHAPHILLDAQLHPVLCPHFSHPEMVLMADSAGISGKGGQVFLQRKSHYIEQLFASAAGINQVSPCTGEMRSGILLLSLTSKYSK